MAHTFCSRMARAGDLSLSATATEVNTWLLIELPEPWGRDALEESSLPPEVRSYLLEWEAEMDGRRVQFIRRELKTFDHTGAITVFAAFTDHSQPIYRFQLDNHVDLLDLTLKRIEEQRPAASFRHSDLVFITCTNGRRDPCCAKWGRAMAEAMAAEAPRLAWQTTHLGGHRFAPTLVVLPHGAQYGWLEPDEAASLIQAHRDGHLYDLDRYRGHVGFSPPAQAAAIFLRRTKGYRDIDAFTLVSVEQRERTWHVRLRSETATYEVEITRTEGGPILPSCGADYRPAARFMPMGYQTI